MTCIESFMPIILKMEEEESTVSPVVSTPEGIHFLYVKHNNLYLVAVTKKNSNAASILFFLHKLVEVGGVCFGDCLANPDLKILLTRVHSSPPSLRPSGIRGIFQAIGRRIDKG